MFKKLLLLILMFVSFSSVGYSLEFISTWNTSKSGSSDSLSISLPLESSGNYNFYVDWGDNTNDTITSSSQKEHLYPSEGVYTVKISGTIIGFRFNNNNDRKKIINIEQ
ncbi:MAG: hypothetical protein HRU03_02865 [Nanoarchaeales archaeon]|nr:hypothetical protein [Nanoarchaeales archaeon]